MKNRIQIAAVAMGVVLVAFSSCRKNDVQKFTSDSDIEITAFVQQPEAEMNEKVVVFDDVNANFSIANEGISADYLVDETDLEITQGPGNGLNDQDRAGIRSKSFIACLRGLQLGERQTAAVKKALGVYADCREHAIRRARAIYAELQQAYKAKAHKLMELAKAGKISREQLAKGLHELRLNFNKELRAMQLKEKLDIALQNCYRKFLVSLKEILTEKQWAAFVACHKK